MTPSHVQTHLTSFTTTFTSFVDRNSPSSRTTVPAPVLPAAHLSWVSQMVSSRLKRAFSSATLNSRCTSSSLSTTHELSAFLCVCRWNIFSSIEPACRHRAGGGGALRGDTGGRLTGLVTGKIQRGYTYARPGGSFLIGDNPSSKIRHLILKVRFTPL